MSEGRSANAPGSIRAASIRIDRLLVYLRFARTRSAADALIAGRALRRNRQHVLRGSEQARIGDVLTLATSDGVRVIEVLALPRRRESPAMARSHYREVDAAGLDRKGQMTIAASPLTAGLAPEDPEDSHLKEPQ
jgi:ribosome-associated heat shock protein Hsp15